MKRAHSSPEHAPDSHAPASPIRLPLSALLSHVLVAFTIEFDNEFEHRMPHWTTDFGATSGSRQCVWLGSLVLWSNCMRFVGPEGIAVRDLENLALTPANLEGMERWRYVTIAPDPADPAARPPRARWIIRATPAGRQASEIWQSLFPLIEQRWEDRFGKEAIQLLRNSLSNLVGQFEIQLPDCLPILGYGLITAGRLQTRPASPESLTGSDLSLAALLSKALIAFALEFESQSPLSLAIAANLLRVLDDRGVPVRDLPALSGVSKESLSMAIKILEKNALAIIGPDPVGSRAKFARLTPKGRQSQLAYFQLIESIESQWQTRFGGETILALRQSLEHLTGDATPQHSPLFLGLEPYPDGWRAKVPRPTTLPHYPMVLHRGGFPDGS